MKETLKAKSIYVFFSITKNRCIELETQNGIY